MKEAGAKEVEQLKNRVATKARKAILTIEVGLSAMFLAFIMVPALGVLKNGVTGTGQTLHLSRAMEAARSAVNAAENLGYGDLTDASLADLVAHIAVPPGVAAPRADAIELLQHDYPDGSRYRAKVITVRVAYLRTEGTDDRGEVVLRGIAMQSH